jgi:hypothetical protein
MFYILEIKVDIGTVRLLPLTNLIPVHISCKAQPCRNLRPKGEALR